MPYPSSPFADDFNNELIFPATSASNFSKQEIDNILEKLLKWLCLTPTITSIRVNNNPDQIISLIKNQFQEFYKNREISPKVLKHATIDNVIVIEHLPIEKLNLQLFEKEIIVDYSCAAAIMRGAHIYAPGVLGMTKDCKLDDCVSIYADINVKNKCKKGFSKVWQSSSSNKVFIANGHVKMTRDQLFASSTPPSGIAIEISAAISGCPPLDQDILRRNGALLQNIPSIICVECLDPQPGETILDMCASPGGKTSHISQKMSNLGLVIAIDKTAGKVEHLKRTCELFKCSNVHCFIGDSTKICSQIQTTDSENELLDGPPFRKGCFDRVLLDAPCSATGNRPQLLNSSTEAVLKSYIPLQHKLLQTACDLLKVNGTLVYSTCSIAVPENEGVVQWALKNCRLQLIDCDFKLASCGFPLEGLQNPEFLQRFGPNDTCNSIGFFIAKFRKL